MRYVLDYFGREQGDLAVSCRHSNETSGSACASFLTSFAMRTLFHEYGYFEIWKSCKGLQLNVALLIQMLTSSFFRIHLCVVLTRNSEGMRCWGDDKSLNSLTTQHNVWARQQGRIPTYLWELFLRRRSAKCDKTRPARCITKGLNWEGSSALTYCVSDTSSEFSGSNDTVRETELAVGDLCGHGKKCSNVVDDSYIPAKMLCKPSCISSLFISFHTSLLPFFPHFSFPSLCPFSLSLYSLFFLSFSLFPYVSPSVLFGSFFRSDRHIDSTSPQAKVKVFN